MIVVRVLFVAVVFQPSFCGALAMLLPLRCFQNVFLASLRAVYHPFGCPRRLLVHVCLPLGTVFSQMHVTMIGNHSFCGWGPSGSVVSIIGSPAVWASFGGGPWWPWSAFWTLSEPFGVDGLTFLHFAIGCLPLLYCLWPGVARCLIAARRTRRQLYPRVWVESWSQKAISNAP